MKNFLIKNKALFLTLIWLAVMLIDLKLVEMIVTDSEKLDTCVRWNISHTMYLTVSYSSMSTL